MIEILNTLTGFDMPEDTDVEVVDDHVVSVPMADLNPGGGWLQFSSLDGESRCLMAVVYVPEVNTVYLLNAEKGILVEKWLPIQGDHALVQDDPHARPTLVDPNQHEE